MEDAATAEISRAQIWQWLRHGSKTTDGKTITKEYFGVLMKEELKKIKNTIGDDQFTKGKFSEASDIFNNMSTSTEFEEFLTLPAYKLI